MFFLKHYRNYTCNRTKPFINDIKYGVHLSILNLDNWDEIAIYDLHGKSRMLKCHLVRKKYSSIPQWLLNVNCYINATYIECKNGSYHGCYVEFENVDRATLYLSYNNGVLHGKSVKVKYNLFSGQYNFSNYVYLVAMYLNGYANQIKLISCSNYNNRYASVKCYNIPLTYMKISRFDLNKILKCIPDDEYSYFIGKSSTYERYINNKLKCKYKWDDFKVISKTERYGNMELRYNCDTDDNANVTYSLEIVIHHEIKRFSMYATNILANYKWEMNLDNITESSNINHLTINLYKAPTFDEYTVVKYKDGKYRKKDIKYHT